MSSVCWAAVNTDNLKQPKAILRYIEVLFSIISFALTADLPGFEYLSQTEALVACGVMAFIWALAWIIIYLLSRLCLNFVKIVNIVELLGDVFFIIFFFAVGVAVPAKFKSHMGDQLTASVVFAWFCFILFAISAFLDFRSVTSPAAAQTAEAAA